MNRYRATFRLRSGPPDAFTTSILIETCSGRLVAQGIAWDRLQRSLARNNRAHLAPAIVLDRIEVIS